MLNATWVDNKGHDISCSFGDGGSFLLWAWDALCKAGVCDWIVAVELTRPHVRSAGSEPFVPLFENRLPHLRTIRMAWGKTTAEEVQYGKLEERSPPDIGWVASYLVAILHQSLKKMDGFADSRATTKNWEDPADSQLNDLV